MTMEATRRSADFVSHLKRYPEDLRDIRRLQRKFALSSAEVALALEAWRAADGASHRLKELLSH
jgi:hypothetical protein